jgi:hypothetical protein
LPNPTDDSDEDVPSDNPYGTCDQNYFLPEWQVGRLPGGIGSNGKKVRFITQTLKIYAERHAKSAVGTNSKPVFIQWISSLSHMLLSVIPAWINPRLKPQAFGFSAAAWKKASYHVFKTIGVSNMVSISPPIHSYIDTETANLSGGNGKSKKKPGCKPKIESISKEIIQ